MHIKIWHRDSLSSLILTCCPCKEPPARWLPPFPQPSPSQLTQLCCRVTRPTFASVIHELCFACSWITLILDRTVWLDGARPANTCNPAFFPWMAPAHCTLYLGSQSLWGGKHLWVVGMAHGAQVPFKRRNPIWAAVKLSIMTLSMTTFSKMGFCDTQHICHSA